MWKVLFEGYCWPGQNSRAGPVELDLETAGPAALASVFPQAEEEPEDEVQTEQEESEADFVGILLVSSVFVVLVSILLNAKV